MGKTTKFLLLELYFLEMANENFIFLAKNVIGSRLPADHPEMYDENGNPIHSELYSVRFEEDEDDEE